MLYFVTDISLEREDYIEQRLWAHSVGFGINLSGFNMFLYKVVERLEIYTSAGLRISQSMLVNWLLVSDIKKQPNFNAVYK